MVHGGDTGEVMDMTVLLDVQEDKESASVKILYNGDKICKWGWGRFKNTSAPKQRDVEKFSLDFESVRNTQADAALY